MSEWVSERTAANEGEWEEPLAVVVVVVPQGPVCSGLCAWTIELGWAPGPTRAPHQENLWASEALRLSEV